MEEIIMKMIVQAEKEENYKIIEYVKEMIENFVMTINCPSNWRDIPNELLKTYNESTWVYEELELWNYVDND